MPGASRLLIRLALVHLLAGATIGALLLAAKGVPGLATIPWTWRAVHVEMLAAGFTLQLAFGVATWILPRDADRPPSPRPAWAACALLNGGLVMAAAGAVSGRTSATIAGRLLEASAVAVFVVHAWPRIRGAREISVPVASPARSR